MRSIHALVLAMLVATSAAQDEVGSIRGTVFDKDFDAPLPNAQVTILERDERTTTTPQGTYVLSEVPVGVYTLVFSKPGYVRLVRGDVVVAGGQLTEVDAALAGDFTELEEFVVRDIQLGAGSEAALLELRFDSPALLDSISSDLMSRAGASDAASALTLVAGASVAEGKFAVIRGLPDRYVSSQMNGARLPSADEDTRAVELDQFPSPVIESIQVSKTFTPDQQGDASGGAVDVRLKGIPDETIIQFKTQYSFNSQSGNESNFVTYEGGGIDFWGRDDGGRDPQIDDLMDDWEGAVGVTRGDARTDFKWSTALGGKKELLDGLLVGGFVSFFYERDSNHFEDARDDKYWAVSPGDPLTPQTEQGAPPPGSPPGPASGGDFVTSLFDVDQSVLQVQWGGLGTLGLETENHAVGVTLLHTRTAEDRATLAEDTRGKEFFFPGYDPDDPTAPGNTLEDKLAAPYLRLETLEYTERTTTTFQLDGEHVLPVEEFELGPFTFSAPVVDWRFADSRADLDQPDKRQFGSKLLPDSFNPGFPPFIPPSTDPAIQVPFKPAANFNQGNLQRIFKAIEEKSEQYAVNVELPFEQWSDEEGYFKFGWFDDRIDRRFDQNTFGNFGDNSTFEAPPDVFWSEVFPFESHPILESLADVDYDGDQNVYAFYGMVDLPLRADLDLITGLRYESTEIQIVNDPEAEAKYFPDGATAPVDLTPGVADVAFSQDDVLPAAALIWDVTEDVRLRGSYSETVARQTFKELSPILQQEFLGGDVFLGNPDLQMTGLRNFDLRLDYEPYQGGLLSASVFYKDIDRPIEVVQRLVGFTTLFPVNYPEGELTGVELELRQDLGYFRDELVGLSVGANATFIESEVTLPADEAAIFADPNVAAPITKRDATNAPEYLYNLYLTYDYPDTGTELGLFYTVKGDTLVAGAGVDETNAFVPSVYAREVGTLNASLTQRLGSYFRLKLQAKNLTNPEVREVYRSEFLPGGDVDKESFRRGIDWSIQLGFEIAL